MPCKNKRSSLLCCLVAALISLSAPILAAKENTVPCWLTNLTFTNGKHMYGVSRSYSASNLPPLHFAKLNAIRNWARSEGIELDDVDENLEQKDTYQINDKTLYFNDTYRVRGKIYSLVSDVSLSKESLNSCEASACVPKTCTPSWLCQNDTENVSILGISAPTFHPNEQLQLAIDNAQQVARIVSNSHVKGVTNSFNVDTSEINHSSFNQNFKINELEKNVSSVTVGNMCHYKGSLISQINFKRSGLGSSHNWLQSPSYNGQIGAVGYAQGVTSTGRISNLIDIAAKNGLFELAKIKNINIKDDLELKVSSSGFYSLIRKSEQSTESVVSAFIADMKMEIDHKAQPLISIWLLEI